MKCSHIVILAVLAVSTGLAKEAAEKAKSPKRLKHAAVGAKVTVSSTSKECEGECGPKALVDGDLGTRWSSDYSAPQRITIDLGKPKTISEIRLHWEAAFATKYHILVSDDGEGWKPEHFFFRMGDKLDTRVDKCKMKSLTTRYIMIELNERVNEDWGFSLYEIEVVAAKPAEKP